ncbi:Protein kinase rad3 [Neolecta irregularis DAH-3]|uniref:Protein kinase rad3 n=1 Tax=Neolecta irregularis (strain DAH-3) TaxID=1198029 RepID=A0A1U7LV73_NEOID|nr:Protein kinase rad3 [Neolecta irregularis DAH-3]|eukprot:OLL26575.1 Protein kinase rad3 [Neolecta irregularis DAH-3]
MNSLQKPRKITILGSDGSEYPFLCKPKDDLRKDARLMEFNGVIIKLLKKDVETAKRRLGIRTYAVIPLNEECGLIEWVNHTRPLRDIFLKSYKHKDIPVNYVEIRTILEAALTHPKPAHIFLSKLVTRYDSRVIISLIG